MKSINKSVIVELGESQARPTSWNYLITPNIDEAGSRLEVRRRGKYQSSVT